MQEQRLFSDIKSIAETVPGARGATFFIFGSRARGDARQHSDVDLGVTRRDGTPLPPGVLSDLQDAFDNSALVPRVQVVDMARASERFKDAVRHDAVVL